MEQSVADQTRRALHGVAELVLAGPQYRQSGTIRLAVDDDGIRTVGEPALALSAASVTRDGVMVPIAGRTCAAIAGAFGLVVGSPGNYGDGAGLDPDEVLTVDPGTAGSLIAALATGDSALRRIAPAVEPVL